MDLGLQLWGSSEINRMTNASLSGDKYAAPIKISIFERGGDGRTGFTSRRIVLLMVSLYLFNGLFALWKGGKVFILTHIFLSWMYDGRWAYAGDKGTREAPAAR